VQKKKGRGRGKSVDLYRFKQQEDEKTQRTTHQFDDHTNSKLNFKILSFPFIKIEVEKMRKLKFPAENVYLVLI
jgi:hypothetical protein